MLIYVETSVPSFYFETRPEPEHQARRRWTRAWWRQALQGEQLATSLVVLAELSGAPQPKRSQMEELISPLSLLPQTEEVSRLIQVYFDHKLMPRQALGDADHLALATVHGCHALATWNCQHLANANKAGHIERINRLAGFATPRLVTPYDLLQIGL